MLEKGTRDHGLVLQFSVDFAPRGVGGVVAQTGAKTAHSMSVTCIRREAPGYPAHA